ncbi:MAG: TonB-dependent receptor [Deltaproteobacteria bacterium]|nr:TonB-dependent receptor [Deltaproteobacteria bacterium]
MWHRLPGCLALALALALLPPGAFGQDEGAEQEREGEADEAWRRRVWAEEDAQIEAVTVVVSAERDEETASGTAASLGVIDRAQLDQRAPVDVTGALGETAGVDVQRMSPAGYGANVSIRGSSDFKPGGFGNRVLVLLDGRPVNAPDTHGVDWSALPLFDLARIEVLRGPASALYGSTAVGGVVQLISRPPARGAELHVGQGLAASGAERTQLAGVVSDAREGWGWRLSGWLLRYPGLTPAGQDSLRFNSDSRRNGLRAAGRFEPTAGHRIEADLSWMQSAGGNPGFEDSSLESRSRRFDRHTLGAHLAHRYETGGGFRLVSEADWTRFSASVADPDGGDANGYETHRAALRSRARFLLWGRSLNTAGVELELQRAEGDVYCLGQEGPFHVLAAGAFVQTQVDLGLGFELTGGLRFDALWHDTHQHYVSLSPKLRAAWRPDEQTVVWVAANRGFRAPSVGELYLRYETSFGLSFQGNPALGPEVLWAFELGARRSFADDRLWLEACAFLNEGSDTIEFDYRSLPVSARNLVGTRVIGGELSARADPLSWLRLRASLSLMDARNLEDDSRLLYRPLWKTAGSATFHGFYGLALSAQVSVVGARDYDDFMSGELELPRRSLDAFWLLDLSLRWQSPWKLELALHARNLLDAAYYVVQDYPPEGRTFFFQAGIGFD